MSIPRYGWTVNDLGLLKNPSTYSCGKGTSFTSAVANYLSNCVNPVILDKGIYNIDISFPTVTNLTPNGLCDVNGNILIYATSNSITGTIVVDDAKAVYIKFTATGSVTLNNLTPNVTMTIHKI